MCKFKVVLWDVDGTLLDFAAAEKVAIRKCFEVFDLGECTDEMIADYSVINKKYWERLERGEISKPEVLEGRFREFFGKYGIVDDVALQFNLEYQVRLGDTVCFHEHGLDVIKELKGKVLQYAVTNGTRIAQERKLKNSGLIELFDDVFISDIVGFEKPDVRFCDAVFESIGRYKNSEVLIVGDSLTSDIRGGQNAGIVTCWYNLKGITSGSEYQIDYEIKDLREVADIVFAK